MQVLDCLGELPDQNLFVGGVRVGEDSGLAAAVSNVAAEMKTAKTRMEKWTTSRKEMVACAGWHTQASIARQDNGLPDGYFSKYVDAQSANHPAGVWGRSRTAFIITLGPDTPRSLGLS